MRSNEECTRKKWPDISYLYPKFGLEQGKKWSDISHFIFIGAFLGTCPKKYLKFSFFFVFISF